MRHSIFLTTWDTDAGWRLYDRFCVAIAELQHLPVLHRPHNRPGLQKGRYREKFLQPYYKIIYSISGQTITVVDILDAREQQRRVDYTD